MKSRTKDFEEKQGDVYREIFAATYAIAFLDRFNNGDKSEVAAKHAYAEAHLAAEEYLKIKADEDGKKEYKRLKNKNAK